VPKPDKLIRLRSNALLVEVRQARMRSRRTPCPHCPLPPLRPKRSASGVAGLPSGRGQWGARRISCQKLFHI